MKKTIILTAVMAFLGLMAYSSVAAAQGVPPPPPPPAPEATPDDPGPVHAPPPPPVAQPLPPRCGVYPAPPCYHQPAYRPVPYYRPRFWRLGPYIGLGGGGFGILGAKGPFQYIGPGGFANLYIGMNFMPRFAMELAFIGSAHSEEWQYDPQSLLLWGVTLDAKVNLIRPSWRNRFVPYAQAGVGVYGLVSDNYIESQDLAQGGGFQLGIGLDIYLARWLTIGARLLYRGIIMGAIQETCGDRCISDDPEDRTFLHGLTGEINLSIVF